MKTVRSSVRGSASKPGGGLILDGLNAGRVEIERENYAVTGNALSLFGVMGLR